MLAEINTSSTFWSWGAICMFLNSTALFSCGCLERGERTDSWYNPLPAGVDISERQAIPDSQVHKIREDKQAEAQNLLGISAFLELTDRQVREYGEGEIRLTNSAGKFYLVRGVRYVSFTGRFRVNRYGERVEVLYKCMGTGRMQVEREALIVELDFVPKALYVDWGKVR